MQRMIINPKQKVHAKLIEQIKYLEDLERRGLIEKPTPQTAYKYPMDILPNGRKPGCKTRGHMHG